MSTLTIYTDEELKRIQAFELECLKAVIAVCEKLDIEYFAVGGTALGAVRHGGFIPWDDDIDIGMTRENYQKFLALAPAHLPRRYHLQTPSDSTTNPYPYAKVRINGTRFVEYCNRTVNMHQGIYIDIFPFDEVPDDERLNIRQFKKVQRLVRFFVLRQSPDVSVEPITLFGKVRSCIRRNIHRICRLIPYHWLFDKIEKALAANNGTGQKAVACLFFPTRKTEYLLLTDLYPLREFRFEDIRIFLPGAYKTYLTTHYGNFMEPPPEKERFGHKPYEVYLGVEPIERKN